MDLQYKNNRAKIVDKAHIQQYFEYPLQYILENILDLLLLVGIYAFNKDVSEIAVNDEPKARIKYEIINIGKFKVKIITTTEIHLNILPINKLLAFPNLLTNILAENWKIIENIAYKELENTILESEKFFTCDKNNTSMP